MSTAGFDEVTWKAFFTSLLVYKQRLSGRSGQDLAYVRCLGALEGLSMAERAARAVDIVTFLNSWAARVSRNETPVMLAAWIREQADPLERVASLTIAHERLSSRAEEIGALYASLMTTGRANVRNWSDAANSKALHQLVPGVFVMWDKKIKHSARDYRDFMLRMHRLAQRVVRESPYPQDRIEIELQCALGYPTRKPLAKYLDEFNVVRVGQIDLPAPR
ncbi:MAG: hypothetical protein ACTHQQ_19255 [Solirubrobacteraceae bacterium]